MYWASHPFQSYGAHPIFEDTAAQSGGKPYGDPVPDGTYTIYGTPREDFFRLDPQDENPNDDMNQPNGRWGIRLHKPGQTVGCIAAIDAEQWGKVKPFLLSTRTTN